MEFKSTNNHGIQLSIKLPKSGSKQNFIKNYSIDRLRYEEEKYIKILNTPYDECLQSTEYEKYMNRKNEYAKSEEALYKLVKCHPFPMFQGPFSNTMTERTYEFCEPQDQFNFESYTTFIHDNMQPCQIWKVLQQNDDKLGLHLKFHTQPVIEESIGTLHGPASKHNMAIVYTCQKKNVSFGVPVQCAAMKNPTVEERYVVATHVTNAVFNVLTIILIFQESSSHNLIPLQFHVIQKNFGLPK